MEKIPDEMVRELLEYVKDGRDIWSMAQVWDNVFDVVDPIKPVWLMQELLKHLAPYLSAKDILGMRLVCKKWRYGVDAMLSDHPNLTPFDPNSALAKKWKPGVDGSPICRVANWRKRGGLKDELRLQTTSQVEHFLTSFEDHLKNKENPVPTRSIALAPFFRPREGVPMLRRIARYWRTVYRLLKSFGSHFRFLMVENHGMAAMSTREFYVALHRVLELLPNLQSLEVLGLVVETSSDGTYSKEAIMEYMMTTNPLPPLRNLTYLDVGVDLHMVNDSEDDFTPIKDVSSPINHALMATYGRQAKAIGFRSELGDFQWPTQFGGKLETLQEIILRLEISPWVNPLRVLEGIQAPLLGKLSLSCLVDFGSLFRILNHFPGLKVLIIKRMQCDSIWNKEESEKYPEVQALKGLELNYCKMLNYDFLLKFPQLEYLNFTPHFEELSGVMMHLRLMDTPDELGVHLSLRTLNMSGSAIWKRLEHLKEVQVDQRNKSGGTVKTFSRDI